MNTNNVSKQRRSTVKAVAVLALVLAVTGVWAWRFAGWHRFDEQPYRQTEAIDAVVTETRREPGGYRVFCDVYNRGDKTATVVVLTIRLIDEHGRTHAVNPLVQLTDLKPAAQREADALFSVIGQASGFDGEAQVELVRWED